MFLVYSWFQVNIDGFDKKFLGGVIYEEKNRRFYPKVSPSHLLMPYGDLYRSYRCGTYFRKCLVNESNRGIILQRYHRRNYTEACEEAQGKKGK